MTAASGDDGYSVTYPAASQYVTAVGGTSLTTAANQRGWAESVWDTSPTEGTASGCSAFEPQPPWQSALICRRLRESGHRRRVGRLRSEHRRGRLRQLRRNGGWNVYGGTSVAAPLIAAVYALAGPPTAGSTPSSYPYAHRPIVSRLPPARPAIARRPTLPAGPGYDGPTGLGTPDGVAAFRKRHGIASGGAVTVASPGAQANTVGDAVSLQIKATDARLARR